jgi:hypothetical protein
VQRNGEQREEQLRLSVQRKKINREGMADAWARLVSGRNVGGSGGWAGISGCEQAERRKQEKRANSWLGSCDMKRIISK